MSGVVAGSRAGAKGDPRVPAYGGARMPLSTHLAGRVRGILSDPTHWAMLPGRAGMAAHAAHRAGCPAPMACWSSFPRGGKWFLVAYCFEGRLAHQTSACS